MRTRLPNARSRVLLRALLPLAGVLLLLPGAALAHTVETVSGKTYEGKILVDNDEKVVIETTFDGTVTVPRAEVKAVDKLTPPLRDQLQYRADLAKDDVAKLWDLYKWAKNKGFEKELTYVLQRIVEIDPKNARAHRMLGHEKVDGRWLSPEEKAAYLQEKQAAEMRAKGLVPYQGRWVTPAEKAALEKGLVRDGDEWVTEEEFHRRRGETLVHGEWVRMGEKEGKAWQAAVNASNVHVEYEWSPHFDVYYDVEKEIADRAREGAEKAYDVFRTTLRPTPETWPADVTGRIRLHLFNKLPPYARFALFFDQQEKCSELVPGWADAVKRQHSFWWVQPQGAVGVYMFPNVARTFVSNAVHTAGLVLLTRFRFNFRFPAPWLLDGFAYYLEMEALGYSDTFSLARAGTGAAQASGAPVWADSDKWREALAKLVAEGSDPPMKRLAQMQKDQLGYVELVKSWSVIEFLVKNDPEKFRAWIAAVKADESANDDSPLQSVYGWGWQQLDRHWRAWVTSGFGRSAPPAKGNSPPGKGNG